MSQVTEQSVRFQTALASIKLIQASAVLDLTEDDFDFLTSNKVWIATDRSRAQIGRASCRERVEISVVAVSLKKKKEFGLIVGGMAVGPAARPLGGARCDCGGARRARAAAVS